MSLSLVASFNAPPDADAQQTTTAPDVARLRVGEKLTYSVSFSSFPDAAHIELFVAGRGAYFGREGVELRAHVETIGQVRAALLAVNNYYFTYVDPQTGTPYRAQTFAGAPPPLPTTPDVLEASARTDDVTNVASPASADAATSAGDFVSTLYALRALPLAPGASYPFTTQFAGVQYDAELRVTGRETVNTPAGSFNAIATQVRVRKNKAADDYRVGLYFSDDERHVPVLITARHSAGEIRAALASDDTVLPLLPGQLATQTPDTPPPPRAVNNPAQANTMNPRERTTPSTTPATNGGATSGALGDLPFNVGEQLNLNFYLGNATQPVGTASFVVRSRGRYFNRDGLLITAAMATNDAVARLFPVHDNITTYVNATTLLPFRNELQIQEGTHREQGVVTLDQERGTAIEIDGKSIEIPVGTYDFVSVLYALRSFDLTPPKRNAVSLLINKRPRTLFITSVSRDMIDLGGQRVSAYQLALATDDAQGDRFRLRLWVGTDRRRLPLRLAAITPLGAVRADLSIIPLTRQ
ncbi:MAG: hypothetical protein QOF61_321 [Acidobacteriota bacterium]|nr:hypothetical protein [Acidobacteriota bacterium]